MHFSALKEFAKSPLHYAEYIRNGRKDSTQMAMGRALHELVLLGIQPTKFDGIRRGKEWEAFQEKNAGLTICNATEYESVMRMAQSVNSNVEAMRLLAECNEREKRIEWEYGGIPCAGRVDAYSETAVLELKSCMCAKPKKFLWDAAQMGYDAQMAWYDFGIGGLKTSDIGIDFREHYIIAVENNGAFLCQVFQIQELRQQQAFAKFDSWMEQFRYAMDSGIWHGYSKDPIVQWDAEIIYSIDEDDE